MAWPYSWLFVLQRQHKITGWVIAVGSGDFTTQGVAEEGRDYTVFAAGATEPEDERDRGTDEDLGWVEVGPVEWDYRGMDEGWLAGDGGH